MKMQSKPPSESDLVVEALRLTLAPEEKEMLEEALAKMKIQRLQGAVSFDFFGGPKVNLDSLYVPAQVGKAALEYFAARR